MPTSEYTEALLAKVRDALSPEEFQALHKLALPSSGGRAAARKRREARGDVSKADATPEGDDADVDADELDPDVYGAMWELGEFAGLVGDEGEDEMFSQLPEPLQLAIHTIGQFCVDADAGDEAEEEGGDDGEEETKDLLPPPQKIAKDEPGPSDVAPLLPINSKVKTHAFQQQKGSALCKKCGQPASFLAHTTEAKKAAGWGNQYASHPTGTVQPVSGGVALRQHLVQAHGIAAPRAKAMKAPGVAHALRHATGNAGHTHKATAPRARGASRGVTMKKSATMPTEGSFEDIQDQLKEALRAQYASNLGNSYVYTRSTTATTVAFTVDGGPSSGSYQCDYKFEDGKVVLGVPKAVEFRTVAVAKFEVTGDSAIWIEKGEKQAQQIVYGVVLSPGIKDSQGDNVTAEEIEKAAHAFLIKQQRQISKSAHNRQHKPGAVDAEPVESYIAPVDFEVTNPLGQTMKVLKGAWVMATKVHDATLFGEIEKGEKVTGFSIEGNALRYEDAAA